MTIFDILGPVMVGPSSSHTAGAVRIGYAAQKILKQQVVEARIGLYGSFADTGKGHGTDKALIAGLLGMLPDDMGIPGSFQTAELSGLQFSFYRAEIKNAHPNTAVLKLTGKEGARLEMQAASIGGGRIAIHKLDGMEVDFSAEKPTLIVTNLDMPGHVAKVASLLFERHVNIATMQLYRGRRGGQAVMIMELDQPIGENDIEWIQKQQGIVKVVYMNMEA